MAIPKPITRVEQYLASIAGASDVTLPAYPITREEYYLASWAEKSGFEIAEVDGTPPLVLKDCIGEQFKGLVLYGKSTQVTTTGAQLLDIPDYTGISRGVTVTVKEGLISLHGTCTETGWILIERVTPVSLDGVYILSVYGADKRVTLVTEKYIQIMNSTSASTVNNSIAKRIAFSANKGEVLNVDGIKVMLNAGDTPLPWEPYTGGKPSPSPDYPQEIVSAGEDGSVTVKVTGRNILDMRNSKESVANSGVTYTRNADYSFTRTGTATEALGNVWMAGGYLVKPKADLSNVFCVLLKGVKYSIKDCVLLTVSPAGNALVARNENFVPTQDMYITGVRNENFIVGETYNDIVYPAVYVGEKALQYEPYREQLLTIPTPNGLPGIPVTSGGNYTDENGQQWICDEVDLERGVYVQRIYTVDVAELEYSAGTILQTVKRIFYKISVPSTGVTNKGYCTRLTYSANYSADNPHFYINEERIVVFIPLDTTIKPKEYLVQYILATPIETPLSEADIAAYRALTTYKGTTILESECYLKVKYSKLRK